jgi:putative FmdB family regulatory protein
MPIFDYKCPYCRTVEERMVKQHDSKENCDLCGSAMNKVPSGINFEKSSNGGVKIKRR